MSSPPLRVFLTPEEDRTLWELIKFSELEAKIKDRAQMLRLSSQGWKVEKIASYQKCSLVTVRRTINKWKSKGLGGLREKPRSGRRKKWQPSDLEVVEKRLQQEERSYSSQQLCQILAQETQVELSERHLRRILKKKTTPGKEPESH